MIPRIARVLTILRFKVCTVLHILDLIDVYKCETEVVGSTPIMTDKLISDAHEYSNNANTCMAFIIRTSYF